MKTLDFVTLDVFTTTRFAGNPLAIVHLPASTTLTQDQKQTIAREFNYSETVFLHAPSPANPAEWIVDIFLTNAEVPFAGHPTIGTAVHALSSLAAATTTTTTTTSANNDVHGRFIVKAGPIALVYSPATGAARAAIPHDIHVHAAPYAVQDLWARQPGLARAMQGATPAAMDVVSIVRGMTFVYVQLPDLAALGACALFGGTISAARDEGWEQGVLFYIFYVLLPVPEEGGGGGVVRVRSRGLEGSFEDPATGSASCGLGALLAMKAGIRGRRQCFSIVQAVEIGRRSEIGVEVVMDGQGKVQTIELVGQAVQVMEGKVAYEA